MKKYSLFTLIISLGVFMASCSLDNNIDPNNPQSENLDARMRLASAEVQTYSTQGNQLNILGNIWMNSYAGNIYWFGNPLTKEQNLAIDNGFWQGIWNTMYPAVGNLQTIIDGKQELVYHRAIAKVLKVHYMQYIVDLYNDVPYSEAFKKKENIAPKYDKSIDIYKSFITELDEALTLLKTPSNEDIQVMDTEDVIMGGDIEKWTKFANTVKLRVLMRLSNTTNAEAITLRDKNLPSLKGAEFVDFDVTINPGYSAASADNQNPTYYAIGRRTYTGSTNTQGWRLYLASDHVANALNGDASAVSNGVTDPRASKLFEMKKGKVSGVAQGDKKNSNYTEANFSRFGGWLNTSANEGSAHDGYLMTLAESKFLQSEAAVTYPALFGNAEQNFKDGIKASFALSGIADKAEDYITAIDSKANAGWTASTNKIAAIQYQRWIALIHVNGMETYLNYLKTGFPVTPLALTAQKDRKPYRLVYPQTESTTNATNVPKMDANQPFTKNELTPLYLQ